jgi:isopentenyldiphosphate isomerase
MAKAEWVDLVDSENQVIGRALRQEIREKNLLHRGVAILVRNSQGQVYVHQRTATKDLFPSMYDMFVGGVVGSGEDYLAAAQREVDEELGVASGGLEFLFDHLYQGAENYSWIRVYRVTWDGAIRHQPEEVQWGAWMDESQLDAWTSQVEVVPDGMDVYRAYQRWNSGPSMETTLPNI